MRKEFQSRWQKQRILTKTKMIAQKQTWIRNRDDGQSQSRTGRNIKFLRLSPSTLRKRIQLLGSRKQNRSKYSIAKSRSCIKNASDGWAKSNKEANHRRRWIAKTINQNQAQLYVHECKQQITKRAKKKRTRNGSAKTNIHHMTIQRTSYQRGEDTIRVKKCATKKNKEKNERTQEETKKYFYFSSSRMHESISQQIFTRNKRNKNKNRKKTHEWKSIHSDSRKVHKHLQDHKLA